MFLQLVPSVYAQEMSQSTEERLANTYEMHPPRILELLDMTETTHHKVVYLATNFMNTFAFCVTGSNNVGNISISCFLLNSLFLVLTRSRLSVVGSPKSKAIFLVLHLKIDLPVFFLDFFIRFGPGRVSAVPI